MQAGRQERTGFVDANTVVHSSVRGKHARALRFAEGPPEREVRTGGPSHRLLRAGQLPGVVSWEYALQQAVPAGFTEC